MELPFLNGQGRAKSWDEQVSGKVSLAVPDRRWSPLSDLTTSGWRRMSAHRRGGERSIPGNSPKAS